MKAYTPSLSKSRFIKGLQCHKALWLQTHRPELQDEVSESQQAVFDSGTDVGVLAQQLFPGGTEVPFNGMSFADQIAMTQAEIQKGTKTIYEATFSHNGVFCKVDILHRGKKGWELHEVKSSTGLKDVYANDIAIQYYIVAGSGLPLTYAGLVHIDTSYIRKGAIDVRKLFAKVDITQEVSELQPTIANCVTSQLKMLKGKEPKVEIGPHCETPYSCNFMGHCWKHVPEDSIFDFRGHGRPKVWDLYAEGFRSMTDVPVERLGWRQQLQIRGLKEKFLQVDRDEVRSFLDSLVYPLCFLDFETTYMMPVPMWDGTWPYQQVPFQFSLHVIDKPGRKVRHAEFLAEDTRDPRLGFLDALLKALPAKGTILTWNAVFEKARLQELSTSFPKTSGLVAQVIDRIEDLMVLFRNKSVYHSDFNGSYSIKEVLPALVPDLKHSDLAISTGDMAAVGWLQMTHAASGEERETLKKQLLEYCCLDTYGMVRIFKELQKMAA